MIKLPEWIWATAVALLGVLVGVATIQRDRTRAELADYRAEVATATQIAEREARVKEQTMNFQLARITKNATNKENELASARSAADGAVHRLHDDITSLDAGEAATSPSVADAIGSARTARKLFGQCSDEYRDLAQRADALSTQVTGLQDFALNVCNAGQ